MGAHGGCQAQRARTEAAEFVSECMVLYVPASNAGAKAVGAAADGGFVDGAVRLGWLVGEVGVEEWAEGGEGVGAVRKVAGVGVGVWER